MIGSAGRLGIAAGCCIPAAVIPAAEVEAESAVSAGRLCKMSRAVVHRRADTVVGWVVAGRSDFGSVAAVAVLAQSQMLVADLVEGLAHFASCYLD